MSREFVGQGFADTGCSYHDACLTCPFTLCRYEEPTRVLRRKRDNAAVQARHGQMVTLHQQGLKLEAIGYMVGVHHTTVIHHVSGQCKCQV